MTKNFNVFVEDGYEDEYKVSLLDMARFHWTLTVNRKEGKFPQFQYLGKLSGEGQSGGRWIHDLAQSAENMIVDKIGIDAYQTHKCSYKVATTFFLSWCNTLIYPFVVIAGCIPLYTPTNVIENFKKIKIIKTFNNPCKSI